MINKGKISLAALTLWANDLKAIKPEAKMIKSADVYKVVSKYVTSIGLNIHWRDTDFEIMPFSWWEKVLKQSFWTADEIKYISEVSDCEAFSLFFLSLCELFLKTNGVFSVGGVCKWNTTKGIETSSHRFNFILALDEKDELRLWAYEPMYCKITKIEEGQKIIINNVFGLNAMEYLPTMINN